VGVAGIKPEDGGHVARIKPKSPQETFYGLLGANLMLFKGHRAVI